jgi:recombination protein RecT
MAKATTAKDKMIVFRDLLDQKYAVIQSVMHQSLQPHMLTRLALMAMGQQPDLLLCTPTSVLQSVMTAAELGLRPGGARAQIHFVKYKVQGVATCQPIIDYRGFAHIVRRANPGTDVRARVVYEGDDFELEDGSQQFCRHVPWPFSQRAKDGKDRGEIVASYCATENREWPRTRFDVMPVADILRRREVSKAYQYDQQGSIWVKWFDMMCRKTATKFHCNMQPDQGGEVTRAMEIDDAVEGGNLSEVAGYDLGSGVKDAALPAAQEGGSGKASDDLAKSLMGGAEKEKS